VWSTDSIKHAFKEWIYVPFGMHARIQEVATLGKNNVFDDHKLLPHEVYRASLVTNQDPNVLVVISRNEISQEAWEIIQRRKKSEREQGLCLDTPHALRHGGYQDAVMVEREVKITTSAVRYLKTNAKRVNDKWSTTT